MTVKIPSLVSMTTRVLFPMTLLSASLITPVYANTFHTFPLDSRLHVGSAASPQADDIRGSRYYPVDSLLQSEEGKVGVKVFLNAEGEARDAVVEKSSGFPKLDAAAIRYVKENYDYDLAPGEAMPEFVRTIINFKLASAP
jgi:TonB family protein